MATLADVLDTKRPRAISTHGSRDKFSGRHTEQGTVERSGFMWNVIQQVDVKVE